MDIIKRSDAVAKSKRNLATAAGAPSSGSGSSQQAAMATTPTTTAAAAAGTNGANGGKLVFGLNSRTNRSKHDEYAEQRLKRQQQQQQQQQPASSAQQLQTAGGAQSKPGESGATGTSMSSSDSNQQAAQVTASGGGVKAARSGTPRTSRTSGANSGEARNKKSAAANSQQDLKAGSEMTGKDQSVTEKRSSATTTATRPSDKKAATGVSASASAKSTSVRARSRSPDERVKLGGGGRRKSLEEDLSTIKIEPIRHSTMTKEDAASAQQQQPVLKTRTQFNILPPPQMSITSGKGGSVVGFAKARIYEKPAKPILPTSNLLHQPSPLDPNWSSPWSSALDDQGHIPKSISCGLRPPKQVMVSKARKEWEGGEPFTKCKSRKRLAAQANKKLFPGTWSMTSVVATQQLHLQQALAQSSSTSRRSNIQETDPSVKVLTRGSVLERIQQYERVPSSSSSGASSPSLSSSSSFLSGAGDDDDDIASAYLSRSSSLSSVGPSSDGDASQSSSHGTDSSEGNKKAHYKSRVWSIQNQQNHQSCSTLGPADQPIKSSSTSTVTQRRRLSLKRRSSVLGSGSSSTSSLIPKFYHPNGKPNTYEIEVQKRQIAACFENFPERSAQIEGPNARRHFNQIALACNFTEYFKVPLILYVKHKLETCPHLFAQLNNPVDSSLRQRKTSTVSLDTNGTSGGASSLRRYTTRSNSAKLNQPVKSLAKAASIDSPNDMAAKNEISLVTCDEFLICWRDLISHSYDNAARFVHLLTFGQRAYLLPEDFVPLIQSIIDDHPGLKFLRAAPDFHMRYIQTVIARIYFCINKSWTGKLSLQELRKSNLLAVLQVLSQEEDINQITDYFSYEHFYVIYCKFWNLDKDHDLLISKEDLARHNDAAISSRIIERIFSNVVSKQIHKTGKMNYSDFVWFLIAEEDKKHPRSIEYWFRLMDLDGDGYISMYEMEYFYYEQMKRLELMNIEPLPFLDSACQILDLVNPREKNKISLADLKRTKMATIFFDTFINLEKYLEHESREFVSTRDVVQDGVVVSDWDRYASEEYESLVVEETNV